MADGHLVSGAEVEHAGRRWRVHRPLGPDAVLLRDDAGELVAVDPVRVTPPGPGPSAPPAPAFNERAYTKEQWDEAARRRDLLAGLAARPDRTGHDVETVAAELGLRSRRVWALLRAMRAQGGDVAALLPRRGAPRARRLSREIEAVIGQAVRDHYAQPSRPSIAALHREITGRCISAGLSAPSFKAVHARVRAHDQAWLARRREGAKAARGLRLLTGAHPGADAPWDRVQIDSTPCDILLVREDDRTVIGRPTATFAIDIYSRAVLGFSVSLEAASTLTVATCLVHACLPKDDWLARRDLSGVRWPAYGRPRVLEYDQGPENEARGIQRGLRRYGIAAKIRPKGHPEQHGTIERLIGTMMRAVHEMRGTTFSNPVARGESDPRERACLSLPELERVLVLAIDSYNHTTHGGAGERPLDRYLAWYRQPNLPDAERVPPRLPEDRLLLDFLPYETRAPTRGGVRLFRVDYSSVDLLPVWRRDNGRPVARIVVYDPRSLARVWLLDETTDLYLALPYRVPRPDMTLAQSAEARRALHQSAARDRTEGRLFENVARIRAIEAAAKSATARRKAERSQQAARSQGAERSAPTSTTRATSIADPGAPSWSGGDVTPFGDAEHL
jgi:putative transposase